MSEQFPLNQKRVNHAPDTAGINTMQDDDVRNTLALKVPPRHRRCHR